MGFLTFHISQNITRGIAIFVMGLWLHHIKQSFIESCAIYPRPYLFSDWVGQQDVQIFLSIILHRTHSPGQFMPPFRKFSQFRFFFFHANHIYIIILYGTCTFQNLLKQHVLWMLCLLLQLYKYVSATQIDLLCMRLSQAIGSPSSALQMPGLHITSINLSKLPVASP